MQSKKIILEIYCTYGTGVMLHHHDHSRFETKAKKILHRQVTVDS